MSKNSGIINNGKFNATNVAVGDNAKIYTNTSKSNNSTDIDELLEKVIILSQKSPSYNNIVQGCEAIKHEKSKQNPDYSIINTILTMMATGASAISGVADVIKSIQEIIKSL